MKHPKVVIVILNWNGLQDTLECIESVFKSDYDNFGVVVVDNGSSDGSVKAIRRNYPQTVLFENRENLGFTGGNNIGMRYAVENGADYVWLLNNDTVVEEDTLKKLIKTGDESPNIGLISPVVYFYDLPEKIQFCGGFVDWTNRSIVHPDDNHLNIDKDFVSGKNVCLWGTALLIKSGVIRKIGYLEEKFFAYWEDIDYSIRSVKAGFRNLLDLNAKIYHKHPLNRKPHYFYFMARNQYFFWVQNLKRLEKFSFSRKYLAKRLLQYADLKHSGYDECADACFDGTWSGILDLGGRWDKSVRAPYVVKRILSWHPYFWAKALGGNYAKIPLKILQGARMRIFKK